MSSPARRLALLVPVLALVAACASGPAAPSAVPSAGPATPMPNPGTAVPSPVAEAPTPAPTLPPTNQGNVDRAYPELSVSLADGSWAVGVVDPEAKAWRLVVAGLAGHADDRLEIEAEVGDVAPGVVARVVVDGRVVDEHDLTGLVGDPTATAGGCHPTLQVCYNAGGMTIDPTTGTLTVVLETIETGRFRLEGASATWADEPFVLGPWRTSEPLVTD